VFLRFPGQWVDEIWEDAGLGVGLADNMFRWYENQTGRFTRPDPLGGGDIPYFAYAWSDPINLWDPLGLLPAGFTSDDTCLLCTVFAEAGVTSQSCQRAVASVIINRLSIRRQFGIPTTLCDIVSKAGQFDGYKDPNYNLCERCDTPPRLLRRVIDNLSQPFSLGPPGATFFANNTPAMRRARAREGLLEVRHPQCPSFIFHMRDPFRRPNPHDF